MPQVPEREFWALTVRQPPSRVTTAYGAHTPAHVWGRSNGHQHRMMLERFGAVVPTRQPPLSPFFANLLYGLDGGSLVRSGRRRRHTCIPVAAGVAGADGVAGPPVRAHGGRPARHQARVPAEEEGPAGWLWDGETPHLCNGIGKHPRVWMWRRSSIANPTAPELRHTLDVRRKS